MLDKNFAKALEAQLDLGSKSTIPGEIRITYDGKGSFKLSSSVMFDSSPDVTLLKDFKE